MTITRLLPAVLFALAACKGSNATPEKAPTVAPAAASAQPAKSGQPAPAAAAAPAVTAFVDSTESAAAADVVALGDAHIALVAFDGEHNPVSVRSLTKGTRAEILRLPTGDCAGGTVSELWGTADGKVIAKLGQLSYSSCDEDAEGVAAADLDSHVECVALTWDAATAKVVVAERSPRAKSDDALPAWCKH